MGQLSKRYFLILLLVLGGTLFFIDLKLISSVTTRYLLKATIYLETSSSSLEHERKVQWSKNGSSPAGLNHHIWYLQPRSIDFLCNIPLFPNAPDKRLIIKRLNYFSSSGKGNYTERVFGFLRPSRSGRYKFSISSAEALELWLSIDDVSENVKLIACVDGKKALERRNRRSCHNRTFSEEIELKSGKKYFIEVLHLTRDNMTSFSLQWKTPGNPIFVDIGEKFLLPFFHNDYDLNNAFYDIEIPTVVSCANSTKENPFLLEKHTRYSNHQIFADVLPDCQFPNLRETLKRKRKDIKLKPYDSIHIKYFHPILVYPYDLVNRVGSSSHFGGQNSPAWNNNNMLKKDSAANIVEMFLNKTKERLKL